MAKQSGPFKFEGRLGDVIFYQRLGQFLIRMRRGKIPKGRLKNSPSYSLTRKSNEEFGYASNLGKLLRNGIDATTLKIKSTDINTRLVTRLRELLNDDTHSVRGKRKICAENANLLTGFEWNTSAKISEILLNRPVIRLDRNAVICRIKDLLPQRDLNLGKGATHAVITLVVVIADDVYGTQERLYTSHVPISLADETEADLPLRCELPKASGTLLMAGVGISALQQTPDRMQRLEKISGFAVSIFEKLNTKPVARKKKNGKEL